MSPTCAHCGAEVGDASSCPHCGQSPWRSDTAERPAVRPPVEPAPVSSVPGPPRFPLYADEDVSTYAETAVHQRVEPAPVYVSPPPAFEDGYDRRDGPGVGTWLPWVVIALVMVLVAVGGVWLLLSGSSGGSATDNPAPSPSISKQDANQSPTPKSPATATSSSPAASQPAPSGDPQDVASQATASAPQTAPPNEDVFGNRTTYAAANMLDGRPDTCWRMPGDGTNTVLTFTLAAPTTLTRVGMINGYAKKALVAGHQLDWYVGNRRVVSAQWVFDDGSTLDQPLASSKRMQTIDLPAPVSTSTVQLRLTSVSAPGTGRSARNYTAISEVTLVGTPAA